MNTPPPPPSPSPSPSHTHCVLLCGWKGSGKDTVADMIEKEININRTSFASALKDECSELFKIPRECFEAPYKDEILTDYGTPRDLCLYIGKQRRDENKDYWAKIALENLNKNSLCVITDCRYRNELELTRKHFNRTTVVWIKRFHRNNSSHESENSLFEEDCDLIIENLDVQEFILSLKNSIKSL